MKLYHPFIFATSGNSAKLIISGFYKSLKHLPEEKYLEYQLKHYTKLFTDSNTDLSLDLHKVYADEMRKLPWCRFVVNKDILIDIYRLLRAQNSRKDHLSVMQSTCANVILTVNWERLQDLFYDVQCVNMMFFMAIRIVYELPSDLTLEISRLFSEIEKLPWYLVEERIYAETLDWIVLSYSQLNFVQNLGSADHTTEQEMFNLLLVAANSDAPGKCSPMKNRRLIEALLRLFALSVNCDKECVQRALEMFLEQITKRTCELKFFKFCNVFL